MKVLWCTHTIADYRSDSSGYNGCGWITSLLDEIRREENIEIAVAFFYKQEEPATVKNNIKYYPMLHGHVNVFGKFMTYLGNSSGWLEEEEKHLDRLMKVVRDFRPDIIHVWGTESDMGLIASRTQIPVIVHMQGVLTPISNCLYPPGFSRYDYLLLKGLNPLKIFEQKATLLNWQFKENREQRILRTIKHIFGRTEFDKEVCSLISPNLSYHYCSEVLREPFYRDIRWKYPVKDTIQIMSTLSNPLYKGIDLILKTAKILKTLALFNFEWKLVGVRDVEFIEKKIGILAKDVNVICEGVKNAEEILFMQINSHIYVHTSYIDNSPNSVCEAQMIGLPVIATNVGGVSSLIENSKTGWLIPANDPYMCAATIKKVITKKEETIAVSENEKKEAHNRHNKGKIVNSIVSTYRELCK